MPTTKIACIACGETTTRRTRGKDRELCKYCRAALKYCNRDVNTITNLIKLIEPSKGV